MIKRENILIVTPDLRTLGGIQNHYLGLKKYWSLSIKYEVYGRRVNNSIPTFILFFFDIIKYLIKIIYYKTALVIVNPSFRKYPLFRDGLYIIIAKVLRRKVVTFIHGWDEQFALRIKNSPRVVNKVYGKSEFIYVLYSEFKNELKTMGIICPILLTTTKVEDGLIKDYSISSRKFNINTLLFLARVETEKGIMIAIKAFSIIKQTYPGLKFSVVGDGKMLETTKQYVKDNNITDVTFHGTLTGNDVAKQFISSDIYILPTYQEGMPTSVLEAMAFGLPVISRPVGGLNDFFENEIMGYLIESLEPEDYATKIIALIKQPERHAEISIYNHVYAKKRFLASNVIKQFENDIKQYVFSN
jgi:glycosyltransferase involved in cell wall biosynthesis